MTDPYILQARELLAVDYEAKNCADSARLVRKGMCDDYPPMTVLAHALREHAEKQPTFEQRAKAMKRVLPGRDLQWIKDRVEEYDRHLAEIMAPKPVDPLVEAVNEAFPHVNVEHLTDKLRKALAARGLEIREVQG